MTIQDKINELRKYAQFEGTELGEMCLLLCDILDYPDFLSDKLITMLEVEIADHLENFQKHTRIIKEERTVTHIATYLEWNQL